MHPANAQTHLFHSPVDRIIGRAGAVGDHPWTFFSNPAGTAGVSGPVVGVGYESAYHLKELSSRAAFVVWPTNIGALAGGFSQYGYVNFNIQQYGLTYAREMAPWLRLGLKFNYLLRHQSNFKTFQLMVVDAGLQIFPVERVSLGFYTINPANNTWSDSEANDYHPTVSAASLLYEPSTGLFLEFGLLKEMEEEVLFSFNIEKLFHQQFVIRAGATSAPMRLAFGSGVKYEMFTFDAGLNYHTDLGFSSAFGILYEFGRAENSIKNSQP